MALRSRHLLHATYKMYMMSLALQFVALILLTTYYSLYARDGYSIEGLKMAGKSLEAVSTLVFLLLLILLAKGYTVTRARLKRKTSVKIACFMVVYTCVYIILFILEQAVRTCISASQSSLRLTCTCDLALHVLYPRAC